MKGRVIFVGMHNKPGKAPLDSTTKSGKLIDRVIEQLPGLTCVKSNLWDLDYFPSKEGFNYKWASRVEYDSDDVVVCLGQCVIDAFRRGPIPFIHVGHPSAVWGKLAQVDYIQNCRNKILNLKLQTQK